MGTLYPSLPRLERSATWRNDSSDWSSPARGQKRAATGDSIRQEMESTQERPPREFAAGVRFASRLAGELNSGDDEQRVDGWRGLDLRQGAMEIAALGYIDEDAIGGFLGAG